MNRAARRRARADAHRVVCPTCGRFPDPEVVASLAAASGVDLHWDCWHCGTHNVTVQLVF